MKLKEQIYREILYQVFEKSKADFTQLDLSKKFDCSLSTVNYALKPLNKMGAISKKTRGFSVIDPKKILLYWASIRELQPVFSIRVNNSVENIEKNMPPGTVFGAYTAYRFRFNEAPADYSEVYVYAEPDKVKSRFKGSKKRPNLFVLKKDKNIEKYGKKTTLAQTYVDLWNINAWYAKEYLRALENEILE